MQPKKHILLDINQARKEHFIENILTTNVPHFIIDNILKNTNYIHR